MESVTLKSFIRTTEESSTWGKHPGICQSYLCYIVERTQLIWRLQYYSARFHVLTALSLKNQVYLLVYGAVSGEWSPL